MSKLNPTGIDAYRPAEIAHLVRVAGVAKVRLPLLQMFTLAVLAGAFIGLGAAAYTMAMTGVDPSFGPARMLGGVVFSLGLILVIVGGAELFTGNALIAMAAVDGLVEPAEILRNWLVVFVGNFVGAIGIACAISLTGKLDGAFGTTAIGIAEAKANLGWLQAFASGILCNLMVCLAVWLSLAARTAVGKILAIIWPITGFVLLGLEHSIANLYFFPQGLFAGAAVDASGVALNLSCVTLGNIIGGVGGVALAYRLAYGPNPTEE